jgi:hypothetical protein
MTPNLLTIEAISSAPTIAEVTANLRRYTGQDVVLTAKVTSSLGVMEDRSSNISVLTMRAVPTEGQQLSVLCSISPPTFVVV